LREDAATGHVDDGLAGIVEPEAEAFGRSAGNLPADTATT
jgi:hypothetical protein